MNEQQIKEIVKQYISENLQVNVVVEDRYSSLVKGFTPVVVTNVLLEGENIHEHREEVDIDIFMPDVD